MALWKPDQTFYPSARMAMQAPREKLGYVVTFNPTPANGKHDALCVLDLDPNRKPTRKWSAALKCPTPATSCITLAGTRAAPRCARTRRILI